MRSGINHITEFKVDFIKESVRIEGDAKCLKEQDLSLLKVKYG